MSGASDQDLQSLGQLTGITDLNLEGSGVSDAGLSNFKSLIMLRRLNLDGTKVSAAGVAALQKALPGCKIEWDDPAQAQGK
jgi:hypothetical protein